MCYYIKLVKGDGWYCRPDLELSVEDLSAKRHVVLGRHALLPVHLAPACYIFDEVSRGELERQKRLARTMGAILDDTDVVNVTAMQWVVADPSSKRFWAIIA